MKVLLVGAPFFNYWRSLEDALKQLGHEVAAVSYDDSVRHNVEEIIKEKLFYIKNGSDTIYSMSEERRNVVNKNVYNLYQKFKPDVLLSFGAYFLTKECLEKIRCRKISWIFDSFFRLDEEAKECLALQDCVYAFDKEDIAFIRPYNKSVQFLPLCFDPKVYYPIENTEKSIDVSFVGAMDDKRWEMTQAIYKEYPNLKLSFAGVYIRRSDVVRKIKRIRSGERIVYNNRNITPKEANELYSKSRICINIHKKSLKVGANIRFYELMGSRAFQLVDSNPYITEFRPVKAAVYEDTDDMIRKIEYYLSHEKERMEIAETTYRYALDNDTFLCRAKKIMDEV